MFDNFLTLVSETGVGFWSFHSIRTVTAACWGATMKTRKAG